MAEIVFVNLDECEFFGWEPQKSDLVIDAIIRGIEAGDNFPPVFVYEEQSNGHKKYYLTNFGADAEYPDGGHYRAIGHYIYGVKLKCEVVRDKSYLWLDKTYIPIQSIGIIDDKGQYADHKRRFPNYR